MRVIFILFHILSVSFVFAQDSLKVMTEYFPSVNQNRLKIIGNNTYSLNFSDLNSRKYEIKIYEFQNINNKFDSITINGSESLLSHAMIMDYYIYNSELYLIVRKYLIVYSIVNKKIINIYPLKNEMNVIHEISNNKIYMSLNFLFNPLDEKCSYAISYYDLKLKKHIINELNEYSSISLLAASPYTISFKEKYFFVSSLNDYVVNIYNTDLEKVEEINNSIEFEAYSLYNYKEENIYKNKKDLFYSIIEKDDFKFPRMLGLQSLSSDSLIVIFKLPSVLDSTSDNVSKLHLWIKNNHGNWEMKFFSDTRNGIFPYSRNNNDFRQFKSNFLSMNSFVKYKTFCDSRENKLCTSYSTFIYPHCKIMWKTMKKN